MQPLDALDLGGGTLGTARGVKPSSDGLELLGIENDAAPLLHRLDLLSEEEIPRATSTRSRCSASRKRLDGTLEAWYAHVR